MAIQRINELEDRKIKLDKKDTRIISIMLENSRTPFTKIAKQVMLSKDAVKYRVSKLQEKGLIMGLFPVVDFQMLGYSEYTIKLLLDESKKAKHVEFSEHAKAHPSVLKLWEFSDRWDIEVTVLARSAAEFDRIDMELTNGFLDIIMQKDKGVVVKLFLNDMCPLEFEHDQGYIERLKELPLLEKHPVKLDSKDLLILSRLAHNCRASTYELHTAVKLSADAIGLRIKKMLKAGLIEKYTVALNYSMLNYHLFCFQADLSSMDVEREKKLIDFSVTHPYIFSAKKTLGLYDVSLALLCKSQNSLHSTIQALKVHFADVIRGYHTLIGYREAYFNPFPETLLGQNLKA
jgi:DNA-binding Lrp family transcriptional regulator